MKQPVYVTLPAVIRKGDIAATAALHGCVFAASVVPGNTSPLRYVAFAGARRDDGLYAGQHRFVQADPSDEVLADQSDLEFNTGAEDGIHPHEH